MSTSKLFYDLPEEILSMITEQLVLASTNGKDRFPLSPECNANLRALRLSSCRFGYLGAILKTLFCNVTLNATPRAVDRLGRLDTTRVACFVRSVTILPPVANDWKLSLNDFRMIVSPRAPQDYHLPLIRLSVRSSAKLGLEPSPGETDAFNAYHAAAVRAKKFLRSARLQNVWQDVLRATAYVDMVHFAHRSIESYRPYRTPPIAEQDDPWLYGQYRAVAATIGGAVFAAGIWCLARAKTQIRHLNITCSLSGTRWASLPGWHSVNFTKLRSLHFSPTLGARDPTARFQELWHDEGVGEIVGEELMHLLARTKGTLKTFRHGETCPLYWPYMEEVDLPKLRFLSLGSKKAAAVWQPKPGLETSQLAGLIARLPSLETLELCSSAFRSNRNIYKPVFTAIREHKNRLQVRFRSIENMIPWFHMTKWQHTEVFDYHTGEDIDWARTLPVWQDDPFLYYLIERDVCLYLSGAIEWNHHLEEAFVFQL